MARLSGSHLLVGDIESGQATCVCYSCDLRLSRGSCSQAPSQADLGEAESGSCTRLSRPLFSNIKTFLCLLSHFSSLISTLTLSLSKSDPIEFAQRDCEIYAALPNLILDRHDSRFTNERERSSMSSLHIPTSSVLGSRPSYNPLLLSIILVHLANPQT